jgi:hypothetical protein
MAHPAGLSTERCNAGCQGLLAGCGESAFEGQDPTAPTCGPLGERSAGAELRVTYAAGERFPCVRGERESGPEGCRVPYRC